MRDYLDDVRRAIAGLDTEPVVIGHSLGGYLIQHLLAERDFPAAVLLASVPVTGNSGRGWWLGWRRTARYTARFARAVASRDMAPFIVAADAQADLFFAPTTPRHVVERHTARLQGESVSLFTRDLMRKVPLRRAIGTPALVVAGDADRGIRLADQQATAAALGAEFVRLEGWAHVIPLDERWETAADLVEGWLARTLVSR